MVMVDPADPVVASVLGVLLLPLLVLPLLVPQAVSTAAAASSAAHLVIVSDLCRWYLMGSSWNALLRRDLPIARSRVRVTPAG
jgi:ABC-type transport system involved in cytochrome c biogenesis permease component